MDDTRHDEFLRLYSQHSRRLFDFISMLVFCTSDADDIFQNVCVVLWKKFDSYDPDGSFYAWACKIAYLEVLHARRKSKKLRIFSEEVLLGFADDMVARADDLDARQHALEHCLAKLRPNDKELVRERYHLRKLPKEIAAAQGASVHSIYRALVRVHDALRGCVESTLAKERHA
ncbi:RNA polymerase sigma factor [Botrimarina colliarenosi]|uniref:RNA polymerase sigma factor n=1 Tax=Botrimarina colliarenosi TaxID=2528001 RepID=A0A5C6A702_9BACT|nr:sigma-70 family RNA polymerase sigma factor [Botrimarina colliarenosi]TWT94123.1 RNA polymerase sigma factor [Botrimarina colliarenosi]